MQDKHKWCRVYLVVCGLVLGYVTVSVCKARTVEKTSFIPNMVLGDLVLGEFIHSHHSANRRAAQICSLSLVSETARALFPNSYPN